MCVLIRIKKLNIFDEAICISLGKSLIHLFLPFLPAMDKLWSRLDSLPFVRQPV